MDPKVCGKLLMHHRRGYGVDVEALRDRFPLWQIAGKGPKMGSHEYRRLWQWKRGFVALSDVRRWSYEGPMRVGACLAPLGAPSCLMASSWSSRLRLQVFWFVFGPRKIITKVSFRLDSVWYSFSAKLKNKEKTETGTGL